MKTTAQLVKMGVRTFEEQAVMLPLYQEIADLFYPIRSDFTSVVSLGDELADHLSTSYPLLVQRDLQDQFGVMLRSGQWFSMTVEDEDALDNRARIWLDAKTDRMRKILNYAKTGFTNATKEADGDFTAFGQAVISVTWNGHDWIPRYECHHLRDVAWHEGMGREVDTVFRRWKPTLDVLYQRFGDRISDEHKKRLRREGQTKAKIMHIQIPVRKCMSDIDYHTGAANKYKHEYMSYWIDEENEHLLEEVNIPHRMYVVPRWKTLSGSPYAYSPASIAALPDARLLQTMTHTILEAGERTVRPPLIATDGVVRSDLNIMSDGVTWVDSDYDERLGAALRPLVSGNNLPLGFEHSDRIEESIHEAFYLAHMNLPLQDEQMTAYEVRERVKEFQRKTQPLFEPVEKEYSSPLCELTMHQLLDHGAFGRVEDIPEALQGQNIEFKFESPIKDAEEEGKGQLFQMALQNVAQAMEVDEHAGANFDIDTALRDAIRGSGAPEKWLRSEDKVVQIKTATIEKQVQEENLAMMQEGANAGQMVQGLVQGNQAIEQQAE